MSMKEAVADVASSIFMTKPYARELIQCLLNHIIEELADGKKVTFAGFGTFRVRERKARKGTNPRTGEPISIPAKKVVQFRAGCDLREAIE